MHFDTVIKYLLLKRTAYLETADRVLDGFVSANARDLRGAFQSILGFTRRFTRSSSRNMPGGRKKRGQLPGSR